MLYYKIPQSTTLATFFILRPRTLTYELDLDMIKMNDCAKCLGKKVTLFVT